MRNARPARRQLREGDTGNLTHTMASGLDMDVATGSSSGSAASDDASTTGGLSALGARSAAGYKGVRYEPAGSASKPYRAAGPRPEQRPPC